MKTRGPRNSLERLGVDFRDLKVGKNSGFVMRILNREVQPPQITTVVQQPGQENITVLTLQTEEHPYSNRLYRGTPIEPESMESIVGMLQERVGHHTLAHVALQHLEAVLPEYR